MENDKSIEELSTIGMFDSSFFSSLKYDYQPRLTSKLDSFDMNITQDVINEIVLWKVGRYVDMNLEILSLVNKIKKDDKDLNVKLTEKILKNMLSKSQKGIGLSIASTILRFKNPNIYQILDQRVFRFLYGKNLYLKKMSIDEQIELYFSYLIKLREECLRVEINFINADRIFFVADKQENKKINLFNY